MKNILFIVAIIGALTLMSFYRIVEKQDPPCNMTITAINDSTYVIDNNGLEYQSFVNIALGKPNVLEFGDTVQIIGNKYSVRILAIDSTGCSQQKVINKLN